jgi:hypothetical protein
MIWPTPIKPELPNVIRVFGTAKVSSATSGT